MSDGGEVRDGAEAAADPSVGEGPGAPPYGQPLARELAAALAP